MRQNYSMKTKNIGYAIIVFFTCFHIQKCFSESVKPSSFRLTVQAKKGAKPKTMTLFNPLRKMAADVKNVIEEYKKRRKLAQIRGVEEYYDELLNDANDLAKEIEAVSNEHDTKSNLFYKKDPKSREQALRLLELLQHRTKPFNSLLWKVDQMIAEIKDDAVMPDKPLQEEIGFSVPIVPRSHIAQPKDDVKTRLPDDDVEEIAAPIIKEKAGAILGQSEDDPHKYIR